MSITQMVRSLDSQVYVVGTDSDSYPILLIYMPQNYLGNIFFRYRNKSKTHKISLVIGIQIQTQNISIKGNK